MTHLGSSDPLSSRLCGHPPLRPPGLLLHQRLELIRASLVRVAEKRGAFRLS